MDSIDIERLPDIRNYVPRSVKEAFSIQRALKNKVILEKGFHSQKLIAGADLAIIKEQKKLVCGIILFSFPELKVVDKVSAVVEEKFPYIPGLLSFREGPAIIEAYGKLEVKPDILILDGQGTAHPRGFGIACHIGVILDIPTIGVAKKKLYGTFEEPGLLAGKSSALVSKNGETIGAVLRTKKNTKPVFVSPGHKIDLPAALEVVIECSRGYRVPEPTRQADKYVAELKKEFL
jgi:deoxyribonuclease V